MGKDLIISSNRHETTVAIREDEQLVEIYFQRANEYSLVGSIHKGRVTRVLPGMQSAFVDIGLDRDAFLYVSDFFEDSEEYEQLPATQDKASRRHRGSGRSGRKDREKTAEPVRKGDRENHRETSRENSREGDREQTRDEGRDARRGRRPRRRRSKGGGFPDSKYAPESAAPAPPSGEPLEAEPETDDEILLLPGESLAKYARAAKAREAAVKKPKPAIELDEPDLQEEVAEEPEDTDESRSTRAAAGTANDEEALEVEDQADEFDQHESRGKSGEEVGEDGRDEGPEESAEGEPEESTEIPAGSDHEQEPESVTVMEDLEETSEEPAPKKSGNEDPEITEMILGQLDAETKAELAAEAEAEAKAEESQNSREAALEETADEAASGKAEVRERESRYLQRGQRRGRRRGRGRGNARDDRTAEESPNGNSDAPSNGNGESGRRRAPRSERPPLPSISDLLKEGQEILVQVAKEPLGQKGARITSHIAMPGRYVVYMPTLDHLGVSRKIGSDEERQRLRRILQDHRAGIPGGFIMRTAGEGKTEEEITADMDFLSKLWTDIRKTAEKKPAPALLHHDLQVVERVLRDQVTDDFNSIWVDNEATYESILGFLQRFQPALVKRVHMYTRETPIFDAFNITQELEKALKPKVWLKSGGYIVINQTEALLAIDINTGKYVGKSNRLEDTIVRTNIEAVKEIARQMRLRDLGGIIVVDFIDMEERKNRQKVMQALEEAMRTDRAPNKVLQFNDFGLVAITRKRVKQSLERTLCMPCPYCEGSGYVKSIDTTIGEILTEAHKMAGALDRDDVVLRVHPDVAKVLKTSSNEYLEELEEILGRPVMVTADPLLHSEMFDLA